MMNNYDLLNLIQLHCEFNEELLNFKQTDDFNKATIHYNKAIALHKKIKEVSNRITNNPERI